MDERQSSAKGGKVYGSGIGFMIGLGLHIVPGAVLIGIAGLVAEDIALAGVVVIGLTQLLYMVPAIVMAQKKQQFGIAQGITLAAVVTFLLNAACWGIVFRDFG